MRHREPPFGRMRTEGSAARRMGCRGEPEAGSSGFSFMANAETADGAVARTNPRAARATDMPVPDAGAGFPPFRARLPWVTADLQTVRNFLLRNAPDLSAFRAERIEFPMPDGDRLIATVNWPAAGARRPLVWLVHGITGWEDSFYLRRSADHLLRLGYPTLRFNLRGAGPSAGTCRLNYHAGRTEDLHAALLQLDGRLAGRGLFAVGFSLGGNLLLKYLGEQGRRCLFQGAVTVSAPIVPKEAQRCIMRRRNGLYHRYILNGLKEEAARPNAALTPAQRAKLSTIRSVYEFDEAIVAPANGFAGADEYYEKAAALPHLASIGVPTLAIHALDDPWIPARPYLDFDWSRNRKLTPLITEKGGHVGFHGSGDGVAWHDRCIARFFGAIEAPSRRWA